MGTLARIIEMKARKAASFFTRKTDRVDAHWPLGIRLGSAIGIGSSLFTVAGDDLKIEAPSRDCLVAACGHYDLGDARYYRFYLNGGGDQELVLQLGLDESGTVAEVMLFGTLDEISPQTPDEWDQWLSEETGLIGYKDFSTPDGTSYQRIWDQDGADYLEPRCYDETITDDPFVDEVMTVHHASMLYGRSVAESIVENLLIDKCEDDDGATVQISAGVVIPDASLTVI